MPNVLDAEPMHAFARQVAMLIREPAIADRFQRLVFARLLNDPRHFRPASEAEIAAGPGWPRAAHARGDTVGVFKPHIRAGVRYRTVARRLDDTCVVAQTDTALNPRRAAFICAARRFLDRFDRASFDVAARKALIFARARQEWDTGDDPTELCRPQTIPATRGRGWERLTSLAALRAAGREFHNCLAAPQRSVRYAGLLRDGLVQFWVLRGANGEGLIVAMAPALKHSGFTEVKGPRNAEIDCNHPDLLILANAIHAFPPEPPPLEAEIIALPLYMARFGVFVAARRRLPSVLRMPVRRSAWRH